MKEPSELKIINYEFAKYSKYIGNYYPFFCSPVSFLSCSSPFQPQFTFRQSASITAGTKTAQTLPNHTCKRDKTALPRAGAPISISAGRYVGLKPLSAKMQIKLSIAIRHCMHASPDATDHALEQSEIY
ncbi:hypothetical protein FGO68_gene11381 [Halteria grandinella]|uniref:Uncharacterized protein n=1 Tax=Halteria grandinella TaxID=5974 RepID=A0A8J8SZR2_HALGN|nr:hypothetical protein FGO68_gene11381 [Halteria grandinella]